MTWSLQIQNGDIGYNGPGGLQQVSGTSKVIQDLRDWMLEPEGTDPVNPTFGSDLNGGMNPDGTLIPGFIGPVISGEVLLDIESELRRILTAYQAQQLARIQLESSLYSGQNTYSAGEILASVNNVDVEQYGDTVVATISITTSNGNSLTFTQPVS